MYIQNIKKNTSVSSLEDRFLVAKFLDLEGKGSKNLDLNPLIKFLRKKMF
jgi:hypothetical protein